jgi:hypothetical protein
MKPGRKPGIKSEFPSRGSLNDKLNRLEVDERLYLETRLDNCEYLQKRIQIPDDRRPLCMAGMKFKTSKYTAVCGNRLGDVRFLVAVERTA